MRSTDEVFKSVIQKRNEYDKNYERNDFMKAKAEKPKIFNRIVTVAACAVVAVTVIALALSPFIFRDGNNTVDPGTVGDGSKAEESLPENDIVNFYAPERTSGISREELEEFYEKSGTTSTAFGPILCSTPEKVYFSYVSKETAEGNVYEWDKRSGEIFYACKIPGCSHTDCVFELGDLAFIRYYDSGFLICRFNKDGGSTLYYADENGKNVKTVYEWDKPIDPLGVCTFGKEIYICADINSSYRICVVHDNVIPVSPLGKDVEQYSVTDDGIYYTYTGENTLCITTDDFATSTVVAEDVSVFYTACGHVIYGTTDGKLFCDDEYIMEYSGDNCYAGGYIYYRDGSTLRRVNIDTKADESVLEFRTDGKEDDALEYIVDPLGFVYTVCSTYIDKAAGKKDPQAHFAVYDTTENKKVLIDPGDVGYYKDIVVNDYYNPDYNSTSTLHSGEFIETLKRDGYYAGGVNYRNYNTNNIDHVYNITPKSISDETDELEIFYVKDACHCFMMYKGTIYRYGYDTIGGQLCLWDYDENGTKDLFSCYIWGSGLCYQTVSVTDLSTMTTTTLIQKNIVYLYDLFEFEIKDGAIYIEGRELTFDDGRFSCGELSD